VNRAAIGRIRKPHGIKGGLKVSLYNLDVDMLQNLGQLFVNTGTEWKTLHLSACQGHEDHAILTFSEIPDRTEAEIYRDLEIYCSRENLPDLDEDEYYIEDLIDCEVFDQDGTSLGRVVEILSPGAHDVLRIVQGQTETLIPLVADWVEDIDITAGRILVNSAEEIE